MGADAEMLAAQLVLAEQDRDAANKRAADAAISVDQVGASNANLQEQLVALQTRLDSTTADLTGQLVAVTARADQAEVDLAAANDAARTAEQERQASVDEATQAVKRTVANKLTSVVAELG